MPRHCADDHIDIGIAYRGLVNDAAFEHHRNAVGELEQLIEVAADEQDGRACIGAGPTRIRFSSICACLKTFPNKCHCEEHRDAAIPWRTKNRGDSRDCHALPGSQ
jgi:hypothetical protein